MEGFFAALKAFFDKRQQEMILLLGVAEESADVTLRAQLRAGEANGIFLVSTNTVHCGVLSVLEHELSHVRRVCASGRTIMWNDSPNNMPHQRRNRNQSCREPVPLEYAT